MKKNFFIVAALVFMSVVLIGGCSCAGSDPELVTITDYTEGDKGYTFQFSATETVTNSDGTTYPVKGEDVTLQFYLHDDWKENSPESFEIVVLPKAYFDLNEEEIQQLSDRFEIRMDEEIAKDDGRSIDTIGEELFLDPEFKPYAQVEAKKTIEGGNIIYKISSLSTDIGFVVSGISLNEPMVNIDGDGYSEYLEISIDGGEFGDASHLRIKKSYRESVSITLRAKDSKYEVPSNIYYYRDGEYGTGEGIVYYNIVSFIYENDYIVIDGLDKQESLSMRQYIIGEENGDGTVTFEMTELTSDMYVSFTTRNDDISNVLAKKVVAYGTYDYEAISINPRSTVDGTLNDFGSNFLVGEDAEVWVYMYLNAEGFSTFVVYSGSKEMHYYDIDDVNLVVKNARGEIITDIVKSRSTPAGAPDPLGMGGNVRLIKFTLDGDKISEDLYVSIENVKFHDGVTKKTIDELALNALTFVNNAQDYFYPLFNADAEGKTPFRFAGKYYVGNDVQLKIIFTAETGDHDFASAVMIENTNGEVVPVVEISDTTDLGDGRVQYDVTYTFATENTATTFTVIGL